ncbi:MAG: hypothetical protein ACOYB1_18675 [Limnohabitans sp.]
MRIINTHREPVPPAKVLTEAEILSLCCKVVPVDECSEVGRVGVYEGADEKHRNFDEDEALAQARAAYPKARILKVQVEGIGPPPGTPCGKLYESWIGRNNCCEGVPALAWNMDITPDVLPHGGSIIIAWEGGTGTYQVTTSSNGTYFSDGRKSATGTGHSIKLSASETFCGGTAVTVSDSCSEATITIRSDLGQWVSLGDKCGLPGAAWNEVGLYQRQAISGNLKQIETVVVGHWYAGGLLCDTSGIFTPMPGYEDTCHSGNDCQEWYCGKVTAVQPSEAFTSTCLAPNISAYTPADFSLHCSQSDGTLIGSGYPLTAYSCQWVGGGGGFGSKNVDGGHYAKTLSKTLYKWQC